jgi:hypothetical protein
LRTGAEIKTEGFVNIAFLKGICGWVCSGLFADLVVGNSNAFVANHGFALLRAIGAVLLLIMSFFGVRQFKNLYVPFALLSLIILITVLGGKSYMLFFDGKYTAVAQRYIFIPCVIILSILVYEFNAQLAIVKRNLRRVGVFLFSFLFLLIIIGLFGDYKFYPFEKYNWKMQVAVYSQNEGGVFFIPINPPHWYMNIPSCGQDCVAQHLSKYAGEKFSIDTHQAAFKNDLETSDSSYTVTGSTPELIFQLPKPGDLQYCCIEWKKAPVLETLQLFCLSESREPLFHIPFNLTGNYLHYFIEISPVMKNTHFIQLRFNGLKDTTIEIKQLNLYGVSLK